MPLSTQEYDTLGDNKAPSRRWIGFVVVGLLFGGLCFILGVVYNDSKTSEPNTASTCFPPGRTEGECVFHVVDDLNGNKAKTLSGTPYDKGSVANLTVTARRIEYEAITVDDMERAVKFYTQIFGAVEVDFCSNSTSSACSNSSGGGVTWQGDEHRTAMFSWEINNGRVVPNVTDGGGYEIRSRFFVLGNGLIQLLQFTSTTTGATYPLRDPLTSPCFIGAAHMCLWTRDGLDMNNFIDETEKAAHAEGMSNVAWNRPVPQETRADRARVPKERWANKVPVGPDGAFGGLQWSYFKGPETEQLEVYTITETMKEGVGRAYCDRGAVSSAFVDTVIGDRIPPPDAEVPIPQQLHGVFQFGYRTADLDRAAGFYTEVLGGDMITYPTHGIDLRGDDVHWMVLANETIEAYEQAAAEGRPRDDVMRETAVANLSDTGPMRLDHRFILFDNFVVEPLLYTDGRSFGGKKFLPDKQLTTNPAKVATVSAAFGLETQAGDSLAASLLALQERAKRQGYPDVYIPSGASVGSFPSTHPYSGFEYAYAKGESGESLIFVQINGAFADKLQATMEAAGAVSTRFPSTDPFADQRMKRFCDSVTQ